MSTGPPGGRPASRGESREVEGASKGGVRKNGQNLTAQPARVGESGGLGSPRMMGRIGSVVVGGVRVSEEEGVELRRWKVSRRFMERWEECVVLAGG